MASPAAAPPVVATSAVELPITFVPPAPTAQAPAAAPAPKSTQTNELLGAIATASALGNLAYTQMQPAEQFLSANTHTVLGFLPVALLGLISFQQLSDRTGALLRSGSYASFILIFFACTVLRDVLKVAGVAELHPFSALPYLVLLVASTRVSRGTEREGAGWWQCT